MRAFRVGKRGAGIQDDEVCTPGQVWLTLLGCCNRGLCEMLQANGGATGLAAWGTEHHEWEQLRVCTDGSVPTDALVIYNQDPSGGQFYVDRVEIFETPQSP